MRVLLVVGGGLFGSLAAAHARRQGFETRVFDPGLDGAASHAAAGLFKEAWAGKRFQEHYRQAVPLLDRLYGLKEVRLRQEDGSEETFWFVSPTRVLEANPIRERVTAVGDGWLEAGGVRHEGFVYIAAGIWCAEFVPGLNVTGKAGAAFLFDGEREGRMRPIARGKQALAFVRDAGRTYFSDGTAAMEYTPEHDRQTLHRAADMGLMEPKRRLWGYRPYVPGGPVFRKVGERTWLGTGGRKMGTILGAAFALRLVEEEIR
ncbi:MAG: FAD-binding oxidoreductase [Gemmataceae bacterium]|nr:FAD-binding oxidoreductase [Gemmataceae bacterium]